MPELLLFLFAEVMPNKAVRETLPTTKTILNYKKSDVDQKNFKKWYFMLSEGFKTIINWNYNKSVIDIAQKHFFLQFFIQSYRFLPAVHLETLKYFRI